jgi:hypothetical protein
MYPDTRVYKMSSVYVVIENGEPYENVYTSYASAAAAAKEKYAEEIAYQIRQSNGYPICSDIDVPEAATGTTYLYVEKGIHIYIYKLPIVPPSAKYKNS